MSVVEVYDTHKCSLGEGPLWHPERQALFWFDINAHRMFMRQGEDRQMWQFDEYHSAAGWVDKDSLMIASATALWHFEIASGTRNRVCDLETTNRVTRANDGRADPYGGFWIGTMGIALEPKAGAIYRYYRGELRLLFDDWTIPNAMCFSPCGGWAYFTDTAVGILWKQALDPKNGWPIGEAEAMITFDKAAYNPDGAVVDSAGNIWCAHYGHGKVSCHDATGTHVSDIAYAAQNTTCPAFGGEDLTTLFVTSAAQGLSENELNERPNSGAVFASNEKATGRAEPKIIL